MSRPSAERAAYLERLERLRREDAMFAAMFHRYPRTYGCSVKAESGEDCGSGSYDDVHTLRRFGFGGGADDERWHK